MICDNCTHIEVCKHKEDCNILERDLKGKWLNDRFKVVVECKDYAVKQAYTLKRTYSDLGSPLLP